MPECYTHSLTATRALMRGAHTVASHPAFLAGANGPDPFLLYKRWRKVRKPDMVALGIRMHREKTGQFLCALVSYAMTPVQQSYALGFLCHYATDCVMNPFIDAMCRKGMPYNMSNGHRWLEASIDSELYFRDYKTHRVPLHAGTPVLITEELAQVVTLLRTSLRDVYGLDFSPLLLSDIFHNNLKMRSKMISRAGLRRTWNSIRELFVQGQGSNPITCRMQPAPPLKHLPAKWTYPATGEEMDLTLSELLSVSEQVGAACIVAAVRFWLGEISASELLRLVGDNDSFTGQPSEIGAANLRQTKPLVSAYAGKQES